MVWAKQPRKQWCGQSNHGPTTERTNHGAGPHIFMRAFCFCKKEDFYVHFKTDVQGAPKKRKELWGNDELGNTSK